GGLGDERRLFTHSRLVDSTFLPGADQHPAVAVGGEREGHVLFGIPDRIGRPVGVEPVDGALRLTAGGGRDRRRRARSVDYLKVADRDGHVAVLAGARRRRLGGGLGGSRGGGRRAGPGPFGQRQRVDFIVAPQRQVAYLAQ